MNTSPTFWKKIGVQDWFLKKETVLTESSSMTPDVVYKYIIEKFQASIAELSFADRVIFYHEYIICFSPPDYNKFMDNNKGIFAIIIKESVKSFYEILEQHKKRGKKITASANKWVFRFVSHPDYEKGDKSFIGKLLPGNVQQRDENLRVTFIPRQTGIAQTFDISDELLQDFTFYSDGYYEIPFDKNLVIDETAAVNTPVCFARLETTIPDKQYAGKKLEYLVKQEEILVCGSEETSTDPAIFKVPSEWVSTPHLSIRYEKQSDKFMLAAYGEKTLLNEQEVQQSKPGAPVWTELPLNSRIVLNGIVCINIFKN
jgi:hypothetical protein